MAKRSSPTTADADADLLTEHRAGEVIFRQGDPGDRMCIVERGEVEIVRRFGDHEEQLAVLGKGDFFGEMGVLGELPRSATARCLSDCRLLTIDAPTFDRVLLDHPELANLFMRKLADSVRVMSLADLRARRVAAGVLAGVERSDEVSRPIPLDRIAAAEREATPAAPARLVHGASRRTFPLAQRARSSIGRLDPETGARPDVDLTTVESAATLSRRHAVLEQREGRFFVHEEQRSSNGTWVAGHRLEPGEERELRPGDTLKLGLVELVLESEPEG